MARRWTRAGLAVRVAVVAAFGTVATAGVAWAAAQGLPQAAAVAVSPAAATPQPLVVPDVRRQAFVFAKSALEDAGFAWRVRGRVHGFPANTVVSQSPAPGTRLEDTGAPVVTLKLRRTRGYPQTGRAADRSPYRGTAVRLAAAAHPTGPPTPTTSESDSSAGP